MRTCRLLALTLTFASPVAEAAPSAATEVQLRGPGGQLEAAGAIAAVFQVTLSTIEGCGRSARYRERASALLAPYVARNKPAFMAAMRKLPELAQRSGGKTEVEKVRRELEVALGQLESAGRGVADAAAQRPDTCPAFLLRVERGELDLRKANAQHFLQLGL